jgi:hypothetical protein
MAKKIYNEDKIRSILRKIDQQRVEIREKNTISPTQIINPTSSELVQQLQTGDCTVFFYKKTDGTSRRMKCTLKDREPVPSIFNRPEVMVVWDLDHNNWRSFYPSRVYKLIRNENTEME